jgi:short-subunit dehydrogenase
VATEFFDVARYDVAARFSPRRPGMNADAVAAEGIAALTSGKPLHSAGIGNRLMVGALRVLPRRLMLGVAAWLMQPRGQTE